MKIKLKNKEFDVLINYKKIKHMYIKFDDDKLVVSSNFLFKESDIINYIKDNEEKLYKMYMRELDKKRYYEKFYYLGKEYEVKYHESLDKVGFKDNVVYTKDDEMLNKFIKYESLNVFTSEAKICEKVFNNLPKYSIKIRDMKSRWGTCNTRTNVITLNTKLLRFDLEVIDYVIIHEMCHFFVKNHSKEFWNLVEKAVPNYKEIKRKLK